MVFGSKSVNEASLGCQGKLSPDPLTFTRALLTRNSMSSDWSTWSQPAAAQQLVPAAG